MSANANRAYRETTIRTAGQGKIICMLYDEAIRQTGMAIELLEAKTKQLDKVNNAITKAQDIVTELMVSLDMERGGEIATNLMNVYLFFHNALGEGNIKKDAAPVRNVRNMMASLREAWEQVARDTKAAESQPAIRGVDIAG